MMQSHAGGASCNRHWAPLGSWLTCVEVSLLSKASAPAVLELEPPACKRVGCEWGAPAGVRWVGALDDCLPAALPAAAAAPAAAPPAALKAHTSTSLP